MTLMRIYHHISLFQGTFLSVNISSELISRIYFRAATYRCFTLILDAKQQIARHLKVSSYGTKQKHEDINDLKAQANGNAPFESAHGKYDGT